MKSIKESSRLFRRMNIHSMITMDKTKNPPLIPIMYQKISKNTWINQTLPYETDFFIEDILEDMSLRVYQWISTKEDLEGTTDYDSFQSEFINLLYDKYL